VFDAAAWDPVAAAIVDRLAAEVVALVRAALHRLELDGAAVEVLLGGGMFRTGDGRLLGAIEAGLRQLGEAVTPRVADSHPIVGAALLALDDLGAGPDAQRRARRELGAAVDDIGSTGEVSIHG
jgi:hypothetical protein